MTSRYRIDPGRSRFTVRAFAEGLLSFLGHSPTFAVRDFAGVVSFEDDWLAKPRLDLTVAAGGLAVSDAVKTGDWHEIEGRMRADVLDTAAFPEVRFQASAAATEKLAPGRYRVVLAGTLVLRGVAQPHRLEAELTMFPDGLRLHGDTGLRMSAFGIPPVTALGGTIRLKDEVRLVFDLTALPEAS
jgi:polyisoprenoid-binding protein YceI